MTLRIRNFGPVVLVKNGEILSGPGRQRRLLAILSVLSVAGERGMSRDKLLALLWSEGEPEKSRHALTQSLYHIRKALGAEQIFLPGTDLRLNSDVLTSDVADFQAAIREARFADAADLYAGPFLDGFYLTGEPEFDFWVSAERDRLARAYADALRTLADTAARNGDAPAEIVWRMRLVDHDALDAPATIRLVACLIAAGDQAAALQRARAHEQRMRTELDLPADPAVLDLVASLKRGRRESLPPMVLPAAIVAARGPADTPPSLKVPPVPVRPSRGWSKTQRWAAAAAAVLAFVGLLTGATHIATARAAARAAVQDSTIMVAPFRVDETDAATAYLREGLLDLLTTRIGAAETKHATEVGRVLQAWKRSGYAAGGVVSVAGGARVARQLDAGELVMGSVERGASGVVVHASLIDAIHGTVRAKADVSGSPDSLIVLADRIISALILTEAGDRMGALPLPQRVSPLGLRAYLAGRAAYRRADYYGGVRAYQQALDQDPGFALAALGLAMSADHANGAEQHDRSLALAWAHQSELPPADREYLRAFAGPRYPAPSSASETLAAWEHVVRVSPDRAEAWHQLGESFYYDADVLGLHDGPDRAEDAFRHALRLDPSFAPSRRMLTLLLARQNDTTSLRALLSENQRPDTSDAMSVFVRWRAANSLGDSRELARVRRDFDAAPNGSLRAIAMTSQFDGIAVDDGDRALEILGRRALSDAEQVDIALARHSRALNAGDYVAALARTTEVGARQPSLHPQFRLRVLDALYSAGDRRAARAAAAELERVVDGPPPVARADSAVRLADACVLGQWRLARRDTSGTRDMVRALRAGGTLRFTIPVGANPTACAELLDVSLAVAERGAGARDRLAHLDSMMLSGPSVSDAMRYSNLVVAREYQSIGDLRHAMGALQRRSYMQGWPRYRATGLQLLGSLATELGDTAAAHSAYQRLMATRRRPASSAVPGTLGVARGSAIAIRLRSFKHHLAF
jgi:DNA-binding SARP family transcriptional activator/TolB-like protein